MYSKLMLLQTLMVYKNVIISLHSLKKDLFHLIFTVIKTFTFLEI